jgi:hypothetical protein
MYGEIPKILQGAVQRETLTPEQLSRLTSQGVPTTGAGVNVTSVLPMLILGGIAAWFIAGPHRRGALLWLLLLLVPFTLTAQTPYHREVIAGGDTLDVYGHYETTVTITVDSIIKRFTPPPVIITGVPNGASGLSSWTQWFYGPSPFSFTQMVGGTSGVLSVLELWRAGKVRGILAFAGGGSAAYLTNGKFDFGKWKAKMDTYNTIPIKAAVAQAVADSVLIGNKLIDEPETVKWGGNVHKSTVDSMAAYSKSIFPTLVTNVAQTNPEWEKNVSYKVVDVVQNQYTIARGDLHKWVDTAVKYAAKQNVGLALSMNILNGGQKLAPTCPEPMTGGVGDDASLCAMGPLAIDTIGKYLGSVPSTCLLMMWTYKEDWRDWFNRPGNQSAFKSVADSLALLPLNLCQQRH